MSGRRCSLQKPHELSDRKSVGFNEFAFFEQVVNGNWFAVHIDHAQAFYAVRQVHRSVNKCCARVRRGIKYRQRGIFTVLAIPGGVDFEAERV